MKPRRRPPNKTEKLASVLLMLKRGDDWLIPEPLRSHGTAAEIAASVEWHHEYRHAIVPGNDPRMLTPLRPEDHAARFPKDMADIARVKRGLKRRSGASKLACDAEIETEALDTAALGLRAFRAALSASKPRARMQYTALRDRFQKDFRTGKVTER